MIGMTWEELLKCILAMPEEARKQVVQTMPSSPTEPIPLGFAFEFGTVKEFSSCIGDDGQPTEEFALTRSPEDNKHHPEQYVLLTEKNPMNEYGDSFYEWDFDAGVMIGNVSGKCFEEFTLKEIKKE